MLAHFPNFHLPFFQNPQYYAGFRDEIHLRDLMPTTKARFMGRIIYAFKIMLLHKHFPMDEAVKEGVRLLCHFYLHLYSLPWFTANFAAEAAFQDLRFLERARRYKRYDRKLDVKAILRQKTYS